MSRIARLRSTAGSRRTSRLKVGVALSAVAMLVLAACSGGDTDGDAGEASGDPVKGGSLTVQAPSSPTTLDPVLGASGHDYYSLYPVFDRLINFTEDLQPAPGLAKSWEYTDPQTLVLTLEEGVKFQDGTDFNAEAVKFNLDRARNLETSSVRSELTTIESVDVTDANTVTLSLNSPDSSLPLLLSDRAGMMVSPTALDELGEDFGLRPVGAGPFKVADFSPGDSLTLERSDEYRDPERPHLDEITIRYMNDSTTISNALRSGEIGVAVQMSGETIGALENEPNLNVSVETSLMFESCYFNLGKEPFNNVEARRAAVMAMDREAINEVLNFGHGAAAKQLLPESHWAFQDGIELTFDADEARRIVQEAGLEGTTVKLLGNSYGNQSRKLQLIQDQLNQVGFNAEVTMQETASATQDFFGEEPTSFDAYCAGFTGRPDPIQVYAGMFLENGVFNVGGYSPEGMSDLVDAAKESVEIDERSAAFKPLAQLAQDEALHMPLYYPPSVNVFAKNVGGFVPTLNGRVNYGDLWVE